MSDETEVTQKDLEEYINAQFLFPNSDGVEVLCRVKGIKRNTDESLIGNYNSNPILDTRIFDVEYPDGKIDAFATNVISESIYAQVDDQGFTISFLDDIIDHEKAKEAIDMKDGFTWNINKVVVTTKGWRIKVK